MPDKKKSSRLENRVRAAEKHIRDLEGAAEALDARMKSADLVARVERLEADVSKLLGLTGQGTK